MDFAKPVKAIALPQDVPSTSDRLNKITTSCEIYSGPHDTQYCMEDPEQAFVEYASSRTDEAGGLVSNFMASQDARLSKFEADFKQQQREMTNKIDTVLKAITDRLAGTLPSDTVKNPKLSTTPVLSASSYPTQDSQCSNNVHGSINATTIRPKQPEGPQVNRPDEGPEREGNLGNTSSNPHLDPLAYIATEQDDGEVIFIEIIRDDDEPRKEDPNEGEGAATEEPMMEYFDTLPTRDELTYHRYLMSGLIPSVFLRNPIVTEGCPFNLKIPCNIGHAHIEKAYIDLNSPLNIMTRMMYNWIMRRKLDPRENANGGVSNFTGRIKGMHVFI
ncbi:hypothetical protein Tco_1414887 [Tanacetum coccineum]